MAPSPEAAQVGNKPADMHRTVERLIAEQAYRDALAACTQHYAQPLGRLCMAFTGSQAESEELVQETLLAAYDAFPSYRGEGTVRAWLFGIARRICGRHVEMRRRREARLRLVHDTDRGLDATDMAVMHQRAQRAREALSALKPSEREAVVLRYQAELSFREVAQACGVDEAAARKRVSRALVRLREQLVDAEEAQ